MSISQIPGRPVGQLDGSTPTMVAANGSLRDLIGGATQDLTVTMAMRHGTYFQSADGRPLCVLTRDAVRLPFAAILPTAAAESPLAAAPDPGLLLVGAGEIRLGGLRLVPGRWWSEPAPARVEATGVVLQRAESLGQQVRSEELTGVPPLLRDALEEALAAPPDDAALTAAVARLVGRGPGLTPAGDDLLSGLVVALAATDDPALPVVVQAVRGLVDRTNWLSAALLRYTVDGQPTGELSRLTRTINGSDAVWSTAVRRVLRMGHTSGAAAASGFAVGVLAGTTTERGAGTS